MTASTVVRWTILIRWYPHHLDLVVDPQGHKTLDVVGDRSPTELTGELDRTGTQSAIPRC